MEQLLNVLFLTIVVLGTYASAVIINGRHVCSKCGSREINANETHVHIQK